MDEAGSPTGAGGPEAAQGQDSTANRQPQRNPAEAAAPRREDNPFSFRHFLNQDHFAGQGARPKMYRNSGGRPPDASPPPVSPTRQRQRMSAAPDFASALPDFVQDHLIVEQNMHDNGPPRSCSLDLDNLPDFAIINGGASPVNASPVVSPPIGDIPLFEASADGDGPVLPDFLSDAASASNNGDSTELLRLQEDNGRLTRQLEEARELLRAEIKKNERLESRLSRERLKEREEGEALEAAVGSIERRLEDAQRRAQRAEEAAARLRRELRDAQGQADTLKEENRRLSARGASATDVSQSQAMQAASQIRAAASTAEHSLRQLLRGVEGLKLVASSLEDAHRFNEDK